MSVSELINSINGVADGGAGVTDEERASLLLACDKLRSKLEGPLVLRLAIDMKIFDVAAAISRPDGYFTTEKLASETGADPLLINRIMRYMTAISLFQEVGPGKFKTTPLSGIYVTASPLAQGIIHMTSQMEIISALPAYFAQNGYKNPGDAYDGPFQYARQTKLHCFEWIATQPKLQHAFNVIMGISRSARDQSWFDYFPVSSKLSVKSDSDTLLVDIGGGVGHDLIRLKEKKPSLSGKLIVQDISVVIESISDLPTGIEAMKYDFFTPQPVKGAKAYYLANVLHDWPDKQALQILGNVKEAMTSDSFLLINENVLPETNVSLFSASTDFMMMGGFSAQERTENQFRTLLDEAGLELVKAWEPEDAADGEGRRLLEAVLKK
ncbi:hypothetical protein G7Y89_g8739 [Cudoniella acicularis]|uniref:O-methyltransferase domain-containing protein n=1 Tax=Cudoniella acicularis TaxID=354080 RepID=A0A8H4W0S6_9HELO|nr:hypothetical protein G7Y89_g8739 [Cudoniella acicularis]